MGDSPKPSPFDRLPLEILSLIVSFIDPFDEVRFDDRNHRVAVKLALLLMQVCRSLRCAVQEAKFWLERRFTFDKLVPSSHLKERGWDIKLCGALVSDANLLPILKAKIDWSFRNFDTFELVARYVGLQHVHSLSCDFDTVPPTLQYLSEYHNLTDLSLIFGDLNQVLDLDSLTKGVAKLPLNSLYLGYPRNVTGSLRIQNLKELTLTPTDPEKHGEIAPASLFPFDSAATLRTLTIFDCMTDSLLQFPHLKSLTVELGRDADYGMDNMLASYPGKLSQLSIHIPLGHNQAIDDDDYIHHWALFDCDAVSQVTRLDLRVELACGYSTSNYITICTYILGRMVARMRMLEDLTLYASVDGDTVVNLFSRLPRLKLLSWRSPQKYMAAKKRTIMNRIISPEAFKRVSFRTDRRTVAHRFLANQ